MGATLRYAKVIDRERFALQGAQIRPGLDSAVRLTDEPPARVGPFLVLRSWVGYDGSMTERWLIQDPHGRTLYEGSPRDMQAADTEDLADEVDDLVVEFADDGYQLVLEVDGNEVARVNFPVLDHQRDESTDAQAATS